MDTPRRAAPRARVLQHDPGCHKATARTSCHNVLSLHSLWKLEYHPHWFISTRLRALNGMRTDLRISIRVIGRCDIDTSPSLLWVAFPYPTPSLHPAPSVQLKLSSLATQIQFLTSKELITRFPRSVIYRVTRHDCLRMVPSTPSPPVRIFIGKYEARRLTEMKMPLICLAF